MKPSLLTVVASLVGAALLGLLIYGVTGQAANRTLDEALARGEQPPAPMQTASVPALSGDGNTTLAAYHGKVVLLNFWASWCVDCQQEAKVLERAQRKLERHGATVVGITWEDPTTDSEKFVREYGLTFPNYHDANGELVSAFGTRELPESFLINRNGDIEDIARGEIGQGFVKRALAAAEQA